MQALQCHSGSAQSLHPKHSNSASVGFQPVANHEHLEVEWITLKRAVALPAAQLHSALAKATECSLPTTRRICRLHLELLCECLLEIHVQHLLLHISVCCTCVCVCVREREMQNICFKS